MQAVALTSDWISRPKGPPLKALLSELQRTGITIRTSSFDAIAVPRDFNIDDERSIRENIDKLVFIEIKTANQDRVKPGFNGYFFAITESEIGAAEQLGPRHQVALYNNQSGEVLLTTISELLARAKSTTWQLSIQL